MATVSKTETYTLAHTAQCKLRIAADRPDRNLRFLLGHAFLLDKLTVRIVEIEEEHDLVDQQYVASQAPPIDSERRVSFTAPGHNPSSDQRGRSQERGRRQSSPPPDSRHDYPSDSDSSSDGHMSGDEEDAGLGLSLTRFQSASALPPRTISDEEDDSSEEETEEPVSPPSRYTETTIREIVNGSEDEMLTGLYHSVQGCSCQKNVEEEAPQIDRVWRLPDMELTPQHGVPKRAIVVV